MCNETAPMLAALRFEPRQDVDAVLRDALGRLRRDGIVVGGLMQEAHAEIPGQCAILHLVDVRTGERAPITQNRGKQARGCKLDAQGLVAMSHSVDTAISDGVDLIVISRFGRAECEGGGLLPCFSNAVCAGIPVLTAVREPHIERWDAFHGGIGTELAPSPDAVLDWFRTTAAVDPATF